MESVTDICVEPVLRAKIQIRAKKTLIASVCVAELRMQVGAHACDREGVMWM